MKDSFATNNVEIFRIQIIAIIVSVMFLIMILNLIKNRKIKEEYSLLWLFFSIVFLFFSLWREGLDYLSNLIGIAYPPAAVFMILLAAIFMILIQFSMIISKLTENNKTLAQEIALLRAEIEQNKKKEQTNQSE